MATATYVGVRVQGGLLPADLTSRIGAGDMPGQGSGDYHLAAGESVREAANRSWAYLTGVWAGYRDAASHLPESDRGTTLTRDRWLLIVLRELGYGQVPTTPTGGLVVDGKSFPISHVWETVPIHLLGHTVELDRRSQGVAGAATSSPQSMVQELLNRSKEHLWAVLSNGRTLRLLRDSTSLVGSAYVEFDLEAIFDGDLFSDFLLLFSICHESRLEVRDSEKGPASCWLEAWRTESIESGSRALNQLRDGVVAAMTSLGTGFLAHPANVSLRHALAAGTLREAEVNHALLRVVYRLLFMFVAEDRDLLLSPDADITARQRYRDYFSSARLRRVARRRRGTRHTDLWRAVSVVWDGLGSVRGLPDLGLVGIGGLFEPGPVDVFRSSELTNEALLAAVRHLTLITESGSRMKRVVDYRNLGAEELGSIYESLLEFVPSWNPEKRRYELLTAAGNDRKSTGAYYTPTSLIDCLLDSALDPVLDRAEREADPEQALLSVTVCDPACGSGHFLVAAARRIAKRVAAIRTGDPEPPPERVREALADVVGRCLYGVDISPLAVELTKVSLWLETLDPGRPLAFLDAQIKVGNALIGATPALIAGGVPDEAFAPLEGDNKKAATDVKKRNKAERSGQDELFGTDAIPLDARVVAEFEGLLAGARPTSLVEVESRKQRLATLAANPALRHQQLVADAWCAAFVWPLHAGGPRAVTAGLLRALERGESLPEETLALVHELAAEYRFFHWHLEFPHLFRSAPEADGPGWSGGFDVVLGNPPWEHIELKEQEFFAVREPAIAVASGAHRKRLIARLPITDPALSAEFEEAKRHIDGSRHFMASSGRYPLCGRGRIKTDPVFAELGRATIAPDGRFGMILPTGIATDATTQFFFKDLVRRGSIVSLYDFENAKPLFDGVHRSFKFCLLTLAGQASRGRRADFAFFAHEVSDLLKDGARFELTPEEIQLLNPNTGTCPVFRTRRDAEITLGIYRRMPVLINENDPVNGNPWGISFMQGLFNMTSDSHLFHTRDELEADGWELNGNVFERSTSGGAERMMPLYEAKMLHLYDTRWATYEPDGTTRLMTEAEKADRVSPMPRYWVPETEIDTKLGALRRAALMGWRRIARSTDERTLISARTPRVGLGDSIFVAVTELAADSAAALQACWASFVVDFVLRQKMGGTNSSFYLIEQLPMPTPETLRGSSDLGTATHLLGLLAARVDRLNGWIADSTVRAYVRAELDAAAFHLYGLERDDVSYVMSTFPIVKRKDEATYGSYRTCELILAAYDAMSEARESGQAYRAPWTQEVTA